MILDHDYDVLILLYNYFIHYACGTLLRGFFFFFFLMHVGCHLFSNTVISVSKKNY